MTTDPGLYTLSPDGTWQKFDAEINQISKGPQNPIRADEMRLSFSEDPMIRQLSEVVYVVNNDIHYFHGFVSDFRVRRYNQYPRNQNMERHSETGQLLPQD